MLDLSALICAEALGWNFFEKKVWNFNQSYLFCQTSFVDDGRANFAEFSSRLKRDFILKVSFSQFVSIHQHTYFEAWSSG